MFKLTVKVPKFTGAYGLVCEVERAINGSEFTDINGSAKWHTVKSVFYFAELPSDPWSPNYPKPAEVARRLMEKIPGLTIDLGADQGEPQ